MADLERGDGPFWVRADHDGPATLGYSTLLLTPSSIPDATHLREQDEIVYDPDDPDPAKRYKFYVTAVINNDFAATQVWAIFSPDAVTWSAPVKCVLGSGDRSSEDPSVVTMLGETGRVHRHQGSITLLVEDKVSGSIYGYQSADGINFTDLSNPVIPRGGTGAWDELLTGSPCGRHDGTRFVIGYEGEAGTGLPHSFGISSGLTADGLSKLSANPVWVAADDPNITTDSIVVDSMYRSSDGTAIFLLAHSGVGGGSTMYRGRTSQLDPLSWAAGDITAIAGDLSTVRNDVTLDNSSGLRRIVAANVSDTQMLLWTLMP